MTSPTPFADYVATLETEPAEARVFPCVPGGKAPACPNGHHDATSDIAQLRAWAVENPAYNVGLDPHSLGLGVVDIDGKPGEQAWANWQLDHGLVPETYTVHTPHGRHLYFRGVLPTTTGRLAPHIDTRGEGKGYVLIPPSVTPDGAYTYGQQTTLADAPDFLLAMLQTPKHAPAKAASAGVEPDSPADTARAIRFLKNRKPAVEGEGGDAWTVETAAVLRDLGASEEHALELLEAHWNGRCEPPWEPDELAVKVANAFRYAQNEPGCYATGPQPPEWEVFAAKSALDASQRTPGITFKQTSGDYPPPFAARVLATTAFPPVRYTVSKLILKNLVNLLYGNGGAGKTMLAENLAVAIALGVPVWGLDVEQMPVLLALAEDDYGPTKERLEAICALFDCRLADLPITVWCLPGHDLRIAHVDDDGSWTPGPFLEPLRAKLAEIGPCFLLLDTVSDFATLDENKRQPVSTFCKVVLTGLCRSHGVTMLVNAHPSKAAMADGSHYAGSTAWNNAVRNRLSLTREEGSNPRRLLRVEKTNYGQELELELFQVGMTFVTSAGATGADRNALLRDACVRVAIAAAEDGTPIQKQRRVVGWPMDEIKSAAGYRPSDREVKEALANALHAGLIRYVNGSNLMAAGYYPVDLHRAEELARQARKGAGGTDA